MLKRFPAIKVFGILLWIALVVQGAVAILATYPWMTADSSVYLKLAGSLSQGHYSSAGDFNSVPDALRPPGYPVLLFLMLHWLRLPVAAVVVLQVAIYLGTVVMVDRFLKNRGVNPLLFRALAGIYPFGALYSSFLMTEAWALMLLTAIALLVSRNPLNRRTLAAAGALAGAVALIRTDLLLVPLLISGIAFFGQVRPTRSWRASVVDSGIPLVVTALIMLPYALWNLSNFGRFTPAPVAAAAGNSLYLATWQEEVPLDDLNALYEGRATPKAVSSGLVAEVRELNTSIGAPAMTAPINPAAYPTVELQMRSTEVFGQAALERIAGDPVQFGRHLVGNLWRLWNTSRYPPAIPAWLVGLLTAISALVCVAGVAGAILVARRAVLPNGVPAALIMLYVLAVHLPLHTEARYTAAARPLLLMFASLALLRLFARIAHSNLDLLSPASRKLFRGTGVSAD